MILPQYLENHERLEDNSRKGKKWLLMWEIARPGSQNHFWPALFRLTFFRMLFFVRSFSSEEFFVAHFFVSQLVVFAYFRLAFLRLNYFSFVHSFVCAFFRPYIFSFVYFFVRIFFRLYIFSSTQNFVCAIFRPRRFSSVPFFVDSDFRPRRISSVPFSVHANFSQCITKCYQYLHTYPLRSPILFQENTSRESACPRFCRGAGSICERKTVYKSLCLYVRERPSISRRPADLVLLDSRGVADGVVGGPDPRTFENRVVRPPPPQIREWSGQNTVFFSIFRVFWGRLATLPTIRPPTQKSVATPLLDRILREEREAGPSSNLKQRESPVRCGRIYDPPSAAPNC